MALREAAVGASSQSRNFEDGLGARRLICKPSGVRPIQRYSMIVLVEGQPARVWLK